MISTTTFRLPLGRGDKIVFDHAPRLAILLAIRNVWEFSGLVEEIDEGVHRLCKDVMSWLIETGHDFRIETTTSARPESFIADWLVFDNLTAYTAFWMTFGDDHPDHLRTGA